MVCLDEETMHYSHPKICRASREPILTLKCFCSSLQRCMHVIWGEISPGAAGFWPKLGVSLAENLVVDLKFHVRFPSQSSWSLLVNPFWLWNASAAVCNHVHMLFGPEPPGNRSFLAEFGSQLGSKCCVWMKIPCKNPTSGFLDLSNELILTLESFFSSLQPCVYVIWAKSTLELLVFGQNWGSAW